MKPEFVDKPRNHAHLPQKVPHKLGLVQPEQVDQSLLVHDLVEDQELRKGRIHLLEFFGPKEMDTVNSWDFAADFTRVFGTILNSKNCGQIRTALDGERCRLKHESEMLRLNCDFCQIERAEKHFPEI